MGYWQFLYWVELVEPCLSLTRVKCHGNLEVERMKQELTSFIHKWIRLMGLCCSVLWFQEVQSEIVVEGEFNLQ